MDAGGARERKDEKTALTEAVGCILPAGREGIMASLGERGSPRGSPGMSVDEMLADLPESTVEKPRACLTWAAAREGRLLALPSA